MISQFPSFAIKNRHLIEQSNRAGCFHCMKIFLPSEIKNYTDNEKTVLCPLCQTDTVVGNMNGFELSEEILQKAHDFWFKKR